MAHSALARTRALFAAALAALVLLGGCASTGNPRDPLEPINRGVYQFNDALDTVLIKPAAEVYRGVLPQFVRTGISNFFSNLNDVLVALNNLLQGKIGEAGSDVGRIAINTTVGILGFFDPATGMGFEKHNEDFGQTLGRWGLGDGPYLVLPFLGPSNLRDAAGRLVDYRTDPVTYVDPSRSRNQLYGLRVVNLRSELLGASNILETAALDPYEFVRDAYIQRRRNLIYDGNPPRDEDFELKDGPRSRAPLQSPAEAAQAPAFTGTSFQSGEPADRREREAAPAARAPEAAQQSTHGHSPSIVRFWAPERYTGDR